MKPQHPFWAAYALGLLTVAWVAAAAGPGNIWVTCMTLLIGGVFNFGMFELRRHRFTLTSMTQALDGLPASSEDHAHWLANLPNACRTHLMQRMEGRSASLPAPQMAPYLVGLLVMLGMLGTFIGMLSTLSGTAFALQGLTDIQGIRDAFAEPIQGLGLAFGASVAGVATSAMLGLMGTLVRRESTLLWRRLEIVAETLAPLSARHQQRRQWDALLVQTQALPQLVSQMGDWMVRMQDMQQELNRLWLARQDSHQQVVVQTHQDLAHGLEQALIAQWAVRSEQTARDMQSLLQDSLSDMGRQTQSTHQHLIQAHEALLLNQQSRSEQHLQHMEARLVEHLGHLGAALEAPLTRLIEVSTQAPQAAADVIGELRQRINDSMARDNEMLQERAQIMDHLSQVSQSFGQQVQAQGKQLADLSGQLQSSASDVASLSRSFGEAVDALHRSQAQTLTQLEAVQGALAQTAQRSDEQLAYYIAQAREVVELSLSAQQPLLEALERVVQKPKQKETI